MSYEELVEHLAASALLRYNAATEEEGMTQAEAFKEIIDIVLRAYIERIQN